MERHHLLFIFALLHVFSSSKSQLFIGINYGQVADNLPPPSVTASLLQSTTISKLRLYDADLPLSNCLPTPISPSSSIEPPIRPLHLWHQSLHRARHGRALLIGVPVVKRLPVGHCVRTHWDPGIPARDRVAFMINSYPYFAYNSDPWSEMLAFCLFQPNLGRFDVGSKLTYTNIFDAEVDDVRSVLNVLGFPEVEIVVAETGWPYKGDPDEVGASVDNSKALNENLVANLRYLVGTSLMPGRSVDTYLFVSLE
ncbi:glucan endo-1,3-beta-D-glucosidase isoform X2 [Canna indica]|uniref:Glucan endo-1,3-beta-D-glucosidase isoform X2 n=1 Tax=Canna indica TaxID=4628 RepID=A0AAQ3QA30_9LILI|nr:glucan endo-1,3-beta-D-glucosidase isoform X2 [Canna indica]